MVGALGLFLLLSGSAAAQATGQNILLLILDDVGTELVGVYAEGDDPAFTPAIDSLAENGVLFRNAYATPVCSPTRATILTGRYGFANGLGGNDPVDNRLIRGDVPNLPALLPAAYRKAALGKWHLGGKFDDRDERHPVDFAGFEFYAGNPENFRHASGERIYDYYQWPKITAVRGQQGYAREQISCEGDASDARCYLTSVTVDDVIARIREYGSDPWFLWVGFNAIHAPLEREPPRRLVRNTYDYTLFSERRRAHLDAADKEIGRLLRAIRHTDTTVILVGDNGTNVRGCKLTTRECGIRVPLIIKRPGTPRGRHEIDALVNTTDLFETIIELATGEPVSGDADSPDSESLLRYLDAPDDPTLATAHRESMGGPYVYSEKFHRTIPIDMYRALRGDWTALGAHAARDQNYKLVYQRVEDDPSGYAVEEKLFRLRRRRAPVELEIPLGEDRDHDTVPDNLSSGAAAALVDLRRAMTLLQDRDGDGLDYRLDNCVEVANATRAHCGGDAGSGMPCNCDTDADGIGNLCDCDLDNDGFCDLPDRAILEARYGLTGSHVADLDCDGAVGPFDLGLLEEMLGAEPGPSGLWCTDARRNPLEDPPCAPPGS